MIKNKYKKVLIEWIVFTLTIFFLYDIIWIITDFSDFKSNFDEYSYYLILDFTYCGIFSCTSLFINQKLLNHKVFKKAENDRKQVLLCGSIVLLFNIITAWCCEFLIGIIDSDFVSDDIWGTFFLFAIIASVLTLVYLSLHYSNLVIQKSQENIVLQKKYLKLQLDPHFVFNSLSSLAGMIEIDAQMAKQYVIRLSHIYRYMLQHIDQDYISINEAKDFAKDYVDLLNMRYDNKIVLQIDNCTADRDERILALSLQLLIENAVKHNAPQENNTLHIQISRENDMFVIRNNRIYRERRNDQILESYGIGIRNLQQRYDLECKKTPEILIDKESFKVKLPIIKK